MARLAATHGKGTRLEVLLGADDIRGDLAEFYGYVNRSLPDLTLTSLSMLLRLGLLLSTSGQSLIPSALSTQQVLPPDVEIGAGWNACIDSFVRPAAQERIKTLIGRGFHKPGDTENRLGILRWTTWALSTLLLNSRHRSTRTAWVDQGPPTSKPPAIC